MKHAPTVEIHLRGELADLDHVHRAISELATQADITDAIATPLRLALDELITNVVEHGFRDASKRYLCLRLDAEEDAVTATLEDNAPPFDPSAAVPVDTAADVGDRPIGGLGLHIVHESVDTLSYRRTHGRNVVTIRKGA